MHEEWRKGNKRSGNSSADEVRTVDGIARRHDFGWINLVLNTCQLVNNTKEIIIVISIHLFGQFYDNNHPIVTEFWNINYTAFPCSIAHLTL